MEYSSEDRNLRVGPVLRSYRQEHVPTIHNSDLGNIECSRCKSLREEHSGCTGQCQCNCYLVLRSNMSICGISGWSIAYRRIQLRFRYLCCVLRSINLSTSWHYQ